MGIEVRGGMVYTIYMDRWGGGKAGNG